MERWAGARCRRTEEHSAPLDGLLADFRAWSGDAGKVDRAAFGAALVALGVRVWGHAVVVGIALR